MTTNPESVEKYRNEKRIERIGEGGKEKEIAMEKGHVWQGRRNRYSSPGCQLAKWSFDFTDSENCQTGRFDVGHVAESSSRLNALPEHLYSSTFLEDRDFYTANL